MTQSDCVIALLDVLCFGRTQGTYCVLDGHRVPCVRPKHSTSNNPVTQYVVCPQAILASLSALLVLLDGLCARRKTEQKPQH
jgi:hypothetical protein